MNRYKNQIITGAIALIIGLVIGAFFLGKSPDNEESAEHQHEESKDQTWTCSMHPQIRKSEPGQCPICGMDLIPLKNDNNEGLNPDAIQMSERAMKLADVQTTIVGDGASKKSLLLTGKIQEDERLVYSQIAHFPGRIEKLFVNFTGEYISKNQKIASIYSPELVTAQEELFEAKKFENDALFNSAKKKLRLWKLSEADIAEIINSGEIMTEVPIRADVSGVVINKKVKLGNHVMQGSELFEVANLSKVWAVFDAYEEDLQWVSKGDSISFTTPSIPGKVFKAKVTFIDPVINPNTRVALLRTEVNNSEGQLKPEMLLKGNISAQKQNEDRLSIPKSAVMWTGKRSIVYVKTNNTPPTFLMKEITLGPSLGDSYLISEGLSAGDEIVSNGTFTIDASAQLQGKKSMMNKEGQTEEKDSSQVNFEAPAEFKAQLHKVVNQYLSLKDALVEDKAEKAMQSAQSMLANLSKVDMQLLQGEAHMQWMKLAQSMKASLEQIKETSDIETQRAAFVSLSNKLVSSVKLYGLEKEVIYVQRCPMANNDKGAKWLSNSKEIRNPYFGEAMLKCGEVISEIKPIH